MRTRRLSDEWKSQYCLALFRQSSTHKPISCLEAKFWYLQRRYLLHVNCTCPTDSFMIFPLYPFLHFLLPHYTQYLYQKLLRYLYINNSQEFDGGSLPDSPGTYIDLVEHTYRTIHPRNYVHHIGTYTTTPTTPRGLGLKFEYCEISLDQTSQS